MTGRAALELDTLTIRIPIRLQRRGGRKLIMTPEGAAAPTPKPRRDETLVKALVRAHRLRRRIDPVAQDPSQTSPSRRASRTPMSAGSCRLPAWRPTSSGRSSTGGSRRG